MRFKDVEKVLEISPFSNIDASRFPASKPLEKLITDDARMHTYMPGDIIIRRGDYGTSAFFIIRGTVRVMLSHELDEQAMGRKATKRKSWSQALSQIWRNHDESEYRDPVKTQTGGLQTQTRLARDTHELRSFLPNVNSVIDEYKTIPIRAGQFFGEIAALSRTPRTATIFAENVCQVMEIRWQGLRDIRRFSPEFREDIDQIYRERSLKTHLAESPLFRRLKSVDLDKIVNATQFESYGDFDWYPEYKGTDSESHTERIAREPLIAQEGDYLNDLLLIRAGFARKSVQINHGHRTLSYLGTGDVFGLEELVKSWKSKKNVALQHTLRALGYVNVLRVPAQMIEQMVLPQLGAEDMPDELPERQSTSSTWDYVEKASVMNEGFMNFIASERVSNGKATMLIDLNRCTGCDDCVRACASAHDGNPRFARHGKTFDHVMVANACMHCVDPVCMLGCPTGAIHRTALNGEVEISTSTCIGCSNCANNCPYDNIRMVEVGDESGETHFDLDTELPRLQATKCNLCLDQTTGPACQYACPHDALIRTDMRNTKELAQWFRR